MKKQNLLKTTIVVLLLSPIFSPAFADEGPGTSGGGDHERSTYENVESSIGQATLDLVHHLHHFANQPNGARIKNPRIQEMVETIYRKLSLPLIRFGYPDTGKILSSIRVEELCRDEAGRSKAGSARIGDIGGPICISGEVMGQLPKETLYTQMTALIGHEIAHQAGYGEAEAQEFQNYLKHHFNHSEGKGQLSAAVDWLEDSLKKLRDLLKAKAPKNQICTEVGVISGYTMIVSHMGWVIRPSGDPTLTNATKMDNLASHLLSRLSFRELRTFCGAKPMESELPDPEVCRGDVKDLSATVNTLSEMTQSITSMVEQDISAITQAERLIREVDELVAKRRQDGRVSCTAVSSNFRPAGNPVDASFPQSVEQGASAAR
ncbi:MAG: hypothetical protein NDJ89_17230 [Oligoflexia bacterium]|nr:hypothetical protein [Oligoflexia bacterium]